MSSRGMLSALVCYVQCVMRVLHAPLCTRCPCSAQLRTVLALLSCSCRVRPQAAVLNAKEEDNGEGVTAEDVAHMKGVAFTAAAPKGKGRAARGAGRGKGAGGRGGGAAAGRGKGRGKK
jgi:hypothetical protein